MTILAARHAELATRCSPSARTICIDFDGVLHHDNQGWRGGEVYGEPIPGSIECLQELLHAGWYVVILTARHRRFHEDVADWLRKRITWDVVVDDYDADRAYWQERPVLVTNRKLGALVYLDDKGETFTDWATALAELPPIPAACHRPVRAAETGAAT